MVKRAGQMHPAIARQRTGRADLVPFASQGVKSDIGHGGNDLSADGDIRDAQIVCFPFGPGSPGSKPLDKRTGRRILPI